MANKTKNTVAEALIDAESLRNMIKEESTSTLKNLLNESVQNAIREAVDDEEEDDLEIQTGEETTEDKVDDDETGKNDTEAEDPAEDDQEAEDSQKEDGKDEWSEFDQYKVGEDTYDLTGVKDGETTMKVYKLLSDDDNVFVKKDGDKVTIKDENNDAEYVIDLSSDVDDETDGDMDECYIRESSDDIAGLPSVDDEFDETDFDNDVEEDDILVDDDLDYDETTQFENKKTRKTMKENRDRIVEIDLGYTDDYQKNDAIEGLSMDNDTLSGLIDADKGVPSGTEKPFGGKVKNAEPFDEPVTEAEKKDEEILCDEEEPVEEGTNVTLSNVRKKVKSHSPASKIGPKVAHEDSKAGEYKAMAESIANKAEAILAENKKLKESVLKIKGQLEEACVLNVSLGKIVKLFTENAVTQKEKVTIVERFSKEAKTIDQANNLYENIKRDLNKEEQKTLTLERKTQSAEGSMINEQVVYQSKDLANTIDLMKRVMNF